MRNALKVLLVVAFAIPTMASALIANTKHNLTSTGPGSVKFSDPGADMCKFCHIVHDANTTNGTLWGRAAPTGTGFTTPAVTSDGTALPATSAATGPGSQKCLSCHDGTVSMNVVQNSAGLTQIVATSNTAAGGTAIAVTGANVKLAAGSTTYLANLNGQHPVGIPFAGQTGGSASVNEYGTVLLAGCNGFTGVAGTVACVQGANSPAAGAYVKLLGNGTVLRVECSSCHEPHQDNLGGLNAFFLRVPSNIVNGRCGACHKK
jgi:hypothetical protein